MSATTSPTDDALSVPDGRTPLGDAERAPFSVVIPAHNEEAVIARGLQALIGDATQDEIDVIVVCNGCTDRTAEIARSFAPIVRVHEIEEASKIAALNAGDCQVARFPRLYLDADVLLTLESTRALVRHLVRDGALAASPRLRPDVRGCSWIVRAYYDTWCRLPYVREGLVGVGVYALSRVGRQRFGEFPRLISDDGFVRAQYSAEERPVVAGASALVPCPQTVSALVRIKTRSRLGGYELARERPGLTSRGVLRRDVFSAAISLLVRPARWPAACVYTCINLLARVRARRQLRRLGAYTWERDETARGQPA